MVVAHLICMGTCPVTQVSFQQPCEVSGAVSKSFPPYVLDGLATKNAIFGLLRPCSQWSISSICRDSLVLKSCLAVTLPHQVMMSLMMSRLKFHLFIVCGARTKCAQSLFCPFLTAHEKLPCISCALVFQPIPLIFGAGFTPYRRVGPPWLSYHSNNLVTGFLLH